jgi:pimeloyl-ACP methyl ester carboxylesterase
MTQIKTATLTLEYEEFGNPNDPAIVLIMGLGTQMIGWSEPFCNALAAHSLRVIRFDNRDIGLSEKLESFGPPKIKWLALQRQFGLLPQVPYSLYDMAHDVIELLDALDIKKAHVAGASMGGMIAQIIASKYPDRVLTLTSIMSTTNSSKLKRPSSKVLARLLFKPKTTDLEKLLQYMVGSRKLFGSPKYPRSDEQWRELILEGIDRCDYPEGYGRQLAAVMSTPCRRQEIALISVPTLVIHGKQDCLVPVSGGVDTANNIPGATLEIIDGMGHDLPPELQGRLTRLIGTHANAAEAQSSD